MSTLATHTKLKLLRLQLGAHAVALEASAVESIHRAESMRPWPERPDVAGRLTLNGSAAPVFRLDSLLGYPSTPVTPQQPVLVFDSDEGAWGLLVDRVTQLQVPSDQRLPLPARSAGESFFDSVIQREDEMLMVLAARRLFSDKAAATTQLPAATQLSGATRRRHNGRPYLVVFSATAPRVGQRPLVFGVSITQVAEIMEAPKLLIVPGAPAHIAGLVNWRGHAIQVVDLPVALGLPPGADTVHHRLLVLRLPRGNQFVGVRVRHSIEMLRLPVPHIACTRTLPIDMQRVRQIVELEQATLVIPDLAALDL